MSPKLLLLPVILIFAALLRGGRDDAAIAADLRLKVAGPDFRVLKTDGQFVRASFQPQTGRMTAVSGIALPLSDIARIDGSVRTTDMDPGRFQRLVYLATGECFPASVLSAGGEDRRLLLSFGGQAVSIPVSCLACVEMPNGVAEFECVVEQRVSSERSFLPAHRFGDGWLHGRIAVANRTASRASPLVVAESAKPASDRSGRPLVRFEFQQSSRRHVLDIVLENSRLVARCPTLRSLNEQAVECPAGDVVFRLSLRSGLALDVDGQNLFQTDDDPGELIRIVASSDVGLSDLIGRRVLSPTVSRSTGMADSANDRDQVVLVSGDEIFGTGLNVKREGAFLSSASRLQFRWVDVKSLRWARNAVAGEVADGWPVTVTLNQNRGCLSGEGGGLDLWLRGMVVDAVPEGLVLDHPLLKRLVVPWPMIQRVTPENPGGGRCAALLIAAEVRHPGREVMPSFCHAEPDGTELTWRFELSSSHALLDQKRSLALAVDVSELEPGHPRTLRAEPKLEELRGGFLRTTVLLNGRSIGCLNDLVQSRVPAGQFQRVRIPLPPNCLKSGQNTIVMRQSVGRSGDFDESEVRGLTIESWHDIGAFKNR